RVGGDAHEVAPSAHRAVGVGGEGVGNVLTGSLPAGLVAPAPLRRECGVAVDVVLAAGEGRKLLVLAGVEPVLEPLRERAPAVLAAGSERREPTGVARVAAAAGAR